MQNMLQQFPILYIALLVKQDKVHNVPVTYNHIQTANMITFISITKYEGTQV